MTSNAFVKKQYRRKPQRNHYQNGSEGMTPLDGTLEYLQSELMFIKDVVCKQPAKPKTESVRYPMSPNDFGFFTGLFGHGFHMVEHGNHDHGLAAAVRYFASRDILKWIYDSDEKCGVVDIYGSARLPNERKHSIMPIKSAADLNRVTPLEKQFCRCEPTVCQHWNRGDVGFLCDTIYYLNPSQIASMLAKGMKCIHSLHHTFNSVAGSSMNYTYRWVHDSQMKLKVAVGQQENPQYYHHDNILWLDSRSWTTPYGLLVYDVKRTYGTMEWGIFNLLPEGTKISVKPNLQLKFKVMSVPVPIQNVSILGIKYEVRYEEKMVDLAILQQFDDFLYGKKRNSHVRDELDSYMRRLKANPDNFLSYRDFHQELADQLQICMNLAYFNPLAKRAFQLNAEINRATLEEYNQILSQGERLNLFEDALRPVPASVDYTWCIIALLSLFITSVALVFYIFYAFFSLRRIENPLKYWKTYLSAGLSLILGGPLGTVCFCLIMLQNIHAVNGNTFMHRNVEDLFTPDVCIASDQGTPINEVIRADVMLLNTCKFIDRIPSDNYFIDGACHKRLKGGKIKSTPCECKTQDRSRGLIHLCTVDGHVPYSFAGCRGNLEYALRMRFLRNLPEIDASEWAHMSPTFEMCLSELKTACKTVLDPSIQGNFTKWVNRQPETKRQRMIKARSERSRDKIQFAATACVKYEVNIYNNKPLKPRAFFPKTAMNLSRNGPVMYDMKLKIMQLFDGLNTPFIFGPGHNAEDLGVKFERAIERHHLGEDFVSVELDLSMCETTMRGPFLVLEGLIYAAMGVSQSRIDYLLQHTTSFGKSFDKRLSFEMGFCRESGTANTTVGNTVVFAFCILANARRLGLNNGWFALIGGDDAAIYVRRNLVPQIKMLVANIGKLGLKPEAFYHSNPYSGRFFSGRMLQFRDCQGHLRYVHTPLIGRCLAKNLVVKYQPGVKIDPWLREVSIARLKEWGHIPLLSNFNRHWHRRYCNVKGVNTLDLPYREIDPVTSKFFWCSDTYKQLSLVYDVSIEEIRNAQKYIDDLNYSHGVKLSNSTISIMVEADLK